MDQGNNYADCAMRGDMGRHGAYLWIWAMSTSEMSENQLNQPAQEIKRARSDLGLTQRELGAMLECDQETIKKMEYPVDRKTHRQPARRMMRLIDAYLAGYRPPDWPK